MTAPSPRPQAALTREQLLDHWQDEADTSLVYANVAKLFPEGDARSTLERISREEQGHMRFFESRLGEKPEFKPSFRVRWLTFLAGLIGPKLVLALMRQEEGREVSRFLREAQEGITDPGLSRLARESAVHAATLGRLSGARGDPWHHNESGGAIRNIVYGFNDGLTANFGLIAGVVGASQDQKVVLLTGLSGLVASAFSMASSGYLAAQSQKEVDDNEVSIQRAELLLWPDREQAYLATLYQEKGLTEAEAASAASRVMADPEVALRELSREKLGLSEAGESPIREGIVTGLATVFGALVPIVPFFFGASPIISWTAFTIAMLSHFLVGAARSTFTGRGWFRSGWDMFVVGLGVAAVGYAFGFLFTGGFGG
ncbi:MAG TPA: VIT1/CCC1 transporter family protein [Deinococcales bacterium]|nr:VIT1/CCC1 transporter family protein [Deinococcales bacterium]